MWMEGWIDNLSGNMGCVEKEFPLIDSMPKGSLEVGYHSATEIFFHFVSIVLCGQERK